MASEDPRLREQLAQHERALRELEVVEDAEQVIRSHHRGLLTEELAAIGRELVDAQRCLAAAMRSGDDPYRISTANEQVCAIERTARVLQQFAREHDVACTRARAAYLAKRRRTLQTIRGLQRRILRTLQPPT